MTTVAVLGTGKMGGAMASRLAASGFDLVLWNRTPEKAEQLQIGRVAVTAPVLGSRTTPSSDAGALPFSTHWTS